MFVHINPQYTIRFETDCSFLIRKNGIIDPKIERTGQSVTLMPSSFGYILNKVGESDFITSIDIISEKIGVNKNVLRAFLNKITENERPLMLNAGSLNIIFPTRLLVKSDNTTINITPDYTPGHNLIEIRPSIPFSVNLMVTTKCITDCCYCYAKRDFTQELSSEQILSIIDECNNIGVVNLNLTGGDIFTRKDWRQLLQRARHYGYYPFLSTKKPLSPDDICFLKSIGITDIQFSLDSVNPDILKLTVSAPSNYMDHVIEMFEACRAYNIKLGIRSVLCCYNTTVPIISDIYDLLFIYADVIRDWVITPAFFSEHQKDYLKYSANNTDISAVGEFISQSFKPFPIYLSKMSVKGYKLQKNSTVEKHICKNQKCFANSYSMSILASGTCTLCEMLYERPEYNIGSIISSTIKDIWNGEKALSLFSMDQKLLSDRTPCSSCTVFDKCRNKLAKRVCYVDIAKTNNGKTTHEMPDPRCPKAVEVKVIL